MKLSFKELTIQLLLILQRDFQFRGSDQLIIKKFLTITVIKTLIFHVEVTPTMVIRILNPSVEVTPTKVKFTIKVKNSILVDFFVKYGLLK